MTLQGLVVLLYNFYSLSRTHCMYVCDIFRVESEQPLINVVLINAA